MRTILDTERRYAPRPTKDPGRSAADSVETRPIGSNNHPTRAGTSQPSPRPARRLADTIGTTDNRSSTRGQAPPADAEQRATGHCIPGAAHVGASHGQAADDRNPAAISESIPAGGTRL